jgi:DNA-binding winged helix-turn-helix (wHTH) protein
MRVLFGVLNALTLNPTKFDTSRNPKCFACNFVAPIAAAFAAAFWHPTQASIADGPMSSYRFNAFELVPDTRRLLHSGVDVAIGVRVFETIVYLVQHRNRAIGRDELLSAVWGRIDGGDATLAQAVLKARRALGDDGNAQNYIRTVARFGYQWVAPTTECAAAEIVVPVRSVERDESHAETVGEESRDVPETTRRGEVAPRTQRLRLLIGVAAAIVILAAAFFFALMQPRKSADFSLAPVHPAASGTVPGLIMVTPTRMSVPMRVSRSCARPLVRPS